MKLSVILYMGLLLAGCESSTAPRSALRELQEGQTIEVRRGAVVSVSIDSSRVGRDVMMRGVNAVDAAVATAFALAVTWPEAGNIGGGGFMVIHRPVHLYGEAIKAGAAPPDTFIDYRKTAPAAVKPDTFSNNPTSYLLAGTPGTVKGLRM